MKVISLHEPFASLIKELLKQIETRSWKTNYRGPTYIHTTKQPVDSKKYSNQLSLLKNKEFLYGFIICRCDLIDCVYMDKEFVDKIKKNYNEYISGYYEIGRYAWILDNIEILEEPIPTRGYLGLWTLKK